MKKLLVILVLLVSSAHADIYRSVDESGNVVFSDKSEGDDTEQVELPPATVYTPDDKHINYEVQTDESTSPERPSYNVRIVSPVDNEALRSNSGQVTITVKVEPALISGGGEQVKVTLGEQSKLIPPGSSTVEFDNVSRGSNTASAIVVSDDGNALTVETSVRFFLLRASAH